MRLSRGPPARPCRRAAGRRCRPTTAVSASRPSRPAGCGCRASTTRSRLLGRELRRGRARRRARSRSAAPRFAPRVRRTALARATSRIDGLSRWTGRAYKCRGSRAGFRAACYSVRSRAADITGLLGSSPMDVWPVHARFDGPIVMIGFGSIGRGTLPLLERHIAFDQSKFVVIDPVDTDRALLDERKLRFMQAAITRDNYRQVLTPLLNGRRRPRHDRQPVGRHLVGRPDGPLQGYRRPLHRHRQRALAGPLRQRQAPRCRSARTTRCARRCWASAGAGRAA